jgi:uncharacterized membrane protein
MKLPAKDIVLVLSILTNVFLIGAAVTVYALHTKGVPAVGGQRSSMRAAALSLNDAHRAAFMRLLHSQGQAIQAETRSAKVIRDDAWASLAAINFDPSATKRQLAHARDLNALAHRAVEDAVVDFAAALPPAERANFSQAMRRAAAHQRPDNARGRPSAR